MGWATVLIHSLPETRRSMMVREQGQGTLVTAGTDLDWGPPTERRKTVRRTLEDCPTLRVRLRASS